MKPATIARGFTLIELLVVVALLAIASATVVMAMRDPQATQLEREAERLAALLEAARAEARASGAAVYWQPASRGSMLPNADEHFRFVGLPPRQALPQRWLGDAVPGVEILSGAPMLQLGPEPVIGAQSLRLTLGRQQIVLRTDGLGPFELQSASEAQ